jgi:hypothetical protein
MRVKRTNSNVASAVKHLKLEKYEEKFIAVILTLLARGILTKLLNFTKYSKTYANLGETFFIRRFLSAPGLENFHGMPVSRYTQIEKL